MDMQMSLENLRLFEMAKSAPGNTIKAYLTLKNISQVEIAKKHGIWPTDLSKVIQKKRRTRRIRRILANELGLPEHVLFEE